MAKNTKTEKELTPTETLSELLKLPRFSTEVHLFIGLVDVGIGEDESAAYLLPAIQALRSELGRIVANAGDNANLAKIGKVGKDGERKVTIGKGTTTVKAGFVASIADVALWVGEGVKRSGGALSINAFTSAFGEKHPLKVAALEYLESKQPKPTKTEAKPESAPVPEPATA